MVLQLTLLLVTTPLLFTVYNVIKSWLILVTAAEKTLHPHYWIWNYMRQVLIHYLYLWTYDSSRYNYTKMKITGSLLDSNILLSTLCSLYTHTHTATGTHTHTHRHNANLSLNHYRMESISVNRLFYWTHIMVTCCSYQVPIQAALEGAFPRSYAAGVLSWPLTST